MNKKIFSFILLSSLIAVATALTGCTKGISASETKAVNTGNQQSATTENNALAVINANIEATQNENAAANPAYTPEDVKRHKTRSDCWTIVNGNIYNITGFIASGKHKPIIEKACGIEATDLFTDSHKEKPQARETLKQYFIGTIK